LSGRDRVAGDICSFDLYPQDEQDDSALGTDRRQHAKISDCPGNGFAFLPQRPDARWGFVVNISN
jgi:hypothetical protein